MSVPLYTDYDSDDYHHGILVYLWRDVINEAAAVVVLRTRDQRARRQLWTGRLNFIRVAIFFCLRDDMSIVAGNRHGKNCWIGAQRIII